MNILLWSIKETGRNRNWTGRKRGWGPGKEAWENVQWRRKQVKDGKNTRCVLRKFSNYVRMFVFTKPLFILKSSCLSNGALFRYCSFWNSMSTLVGWKYQSTVWRTFLYRDAKEQWKKNSWNGAVALWARSTKNLDWSTGPLACPFARLLARALARLLCSLLSSWDSGWLDGYLFSVFFCSEP